MKGPRSSLSTLPENLSFDNGSTSNDAGIDSQLSWNTMQTSSQNRLPDYLMQSSDQYLQHVRHEGQIAEWSLGETSSASAQLQGDHNERKTEHTWTLLPGAALPIGELNYGPSNIVSLTNADLNSNSNQTTANRPFLLQNSSSSRLPQDLNMSSGFGDQEDNERRVVEHPTSYMSIGSSLNEQMPFGCGGYLMDESGQRPGCSLDGRRTSCKRKALEVHPGQSSGVGSSNYFQNAAQAANGSIGMPRPAGNDFVANDGSELANNPRLRLGDAGAVPTTPFSLTSSGNAAQSSRRNFRLRINGLHPQDPIPGNTFSTEDDFGNADVSSSQNSSIRNRYLDMIPPPAVESGTLRGQSVLLQAPSVRRNQQSRWSGSSSTRSGSSSAPPAISQERSPALYEEASRNIPRSISEHPMFVPTSETGNSPQNSVNWNMIGGNNNNAGNVASTSRAGPSRAASSTAPSWSHRGCPQYPRRLSEMVRRSLLLSSAGAGHGGQSSNHAVRSSFSTAQETALPSAPPDNHRHRASSSRSALLERHLDGALGLPFSMRALAAAGEGRSSMMSEQIRRVLDIMRRGEGLRFEDVMILDHSVLFGMADIHDRHRDMRLDVDNMSYEELLALEERIGDVCTGLSEVTIMSCLKQRKHINGRAEDQMVETEPCSICREEYKEDDDLGTLECGHDFHKDCIKQWLMQKNLCPICKTTGLNS